MGLLSSIKNSVTSAVGSATKVVAAKATAAVATLNTMKKVALEVTHKAIDKATTATYYAAKTVKKYAVVPYEIAHKIGGGLAALGKSTMKAATMLGHKAQHLAHHAGHVLHHKVDAFGKIAQKVTVAALKKVTPIAMHSNVLKFGAKFLKATVLAPALAGIKAASTTLKAINASFDPKVSSEEAKKLWIKAGVGVVETALNIGRFSPIGLAFAIADIGYSMSNKEGKGLADLAADLAVGK